MYMVHKTAARKSKNGLKVKPEGGLLMTKIIIDSSLCVGCGGCNTFCPFVILDLDDGHATVVEDLMDDCIECGLCEAECPEKAIKVE